MPKLLYDSMKRRLFFFFFFFFNFQFVIKSSPGSLYHSDSCKSDTFVQIIYVSSSLYILHYYTSSFIFRNKNGSRCQGQGCTCVVKGKYDGPHDTSVSALFITLW